MPYNFELPPTITGKTPDEQIKQLQNYIYKLVQDLNYFAERGATTSKGLTLDELSLKLESNAETIDDKADKSSVKKVEKKATTIEANVDGFRAEVSKTYTTIDDTNLLEDRVTEAESAIEVNAEGIKTKVERDGVMSAIEQSPETIKIKAKRVDIDDLFAQKITSPTNENVYFDLKNGEIGATKLISPDGETELSIYKGDRLINSVEVKSDDNLWLRFHPNLGSPYMRLFNESGHYVELRTQGDWVNLDVINSTNAGDYTGLSIDNTDKDVTLFVNGLSEAHFGKKSFLFNAGDMRCYGSDGQVDFASGDNYIMGISTDGVRLYQQRGEGVNSCLGVIDINGYIKASGISPDLFSGLSSNIQEQLDNKVSSSDLDDIASSIQSQLNARKITWDCPTKVGEYSTLCFFDRQYASYLLNIRFSQTNQALSNTYLITQGYSTASITQVGGNGYRQNTDLSIRLVQDSRNIETWVELLNNFSYDGTDTIIAHCSCTPLSDVGTCTGYTTYTEPVGGTVVDEITSIPSGLAGLLGKVVYEVDPNTTNGIYCNGKITADSVNSVTISDQWKRYKRLKIYARFPHGKCIQEFDLVMSNQGTNSYGNSSGSIASFNCDNKDGVNNHYLVQMNFCVNETNNGWTFQVVESGWIHLGLPTVSTSHFTSNATTAITGTSYTKWNQRHNSDYCIYKIVGYED